MPPITRSASRRPATTLSDLPQPLLELIISQLPDPFDRVRLGAAFKAAHFPAKASLTLSDAVDALEGILDEAASEPDSWDEIPVRVTTSTFSYSVTSYLVFGFSKFTITGFFHGAHQFKIDVSYLGRKFYMCIVSINSDRKTYKSLLKTALDSLDYVMESFERVQYFEDLFLYDSDDE